MSETAVVYRPLSMPKELSVRIGHFLLIAMMLPMLLPMTLIGMLFGRYGKALKHARLATLHYEAYRPPADKEVESV